jgi:hypothetical protein
MKPRHPVIGSARPRDCPIRYACAVEADLRRGVRWDCIVGAWLWAALIVVSSLIIFGVI